MDALERVDRIDFQNIRWKLNSKDGEENWSNERIEEAEALYKAYLALLLCYAELNDSLAPPILADDYWHAHILDTRKYMADCNKLFGEYLHHFPYFGMRGKEDAEALVESSKLVFGLLRHHFFSIPKYKYLVSKYGENTDCSNCGKSCSSCKDCVSILDSKARLATPLSA